MERDHKRIRLNGNGGSHTFSALRQNLAEQLLTASREDPSRAQTLISEGADAWYQDDVGWTCLHHAAASGHVDLVRWLLRNGAVWNMTDVTGLTAGDVAFSMNDAELYDVILQEGIRVEMLKAVLGDDSDDEEDQPPRESASDLATFLKTRLHFEGQPGEERCIDQEGNAVMMAWESNIMKETATLLCRQHKGTVEEPFAVMNVGFGLGLIDTALQSYAPTRHLIIEAHPDVQAFMRSKGWYDKPGVDIFTGTWQQYLDQTANGEREAEVFDVIYWCAPASLLLHWRDAESKVRDTFSENYRALHAFFDALPNLLRDDHSHFSFFNGLGATSRLFLDVYTAVSELHLREIGLETEWTDVEVENAEIVWNGVKRRYWDVPATYRLPICKLGHAMNT